MVAEWIPSGIAVLAGAVCFGKISQMATDSRKAIDKLVSATTAMHAMLFELQREETAKRADEDNEIRRSFVSWQKCQDCPARMTECVQRNLTKHGG